MMIPKRRLLTLIFACLCFKKLLLINNLLYDNIISILHKISGIVKKKTAKLTFAS